jgi:hypothetical protein
MPNMKDDKRLGEYKDLSGLSLNDFRTGMWLVRNRRRIYRLAVAVLIIISVFLFAYSGYYLIRYFQPESQGNTDFLVFPRQTPEPLSYSGVSVITAGSNHDLVVKVKNMNEKYIAYIDYCFVQGDKQVACDRNFIFPEEEKYIFNLGVEGVEMGNVSFSLVSTDWQRVDLHKVPDWDNFLTERLDFSISGISFKKDSQGFYQLEFSVKNNTPYGYLQVPLSILLYSDSKLIGVNRYFLKPFNSGQEKDVRLTWSAYSSSASRVEIIPDLDVYDDASYLKSSDF